MLLSCPNDAPCVCFTSKLFTSSLSWSAVIIWRQWKGKRQRGTAGLRPSVLRRQITSRFVIVFCSHKSVWMSRQSLHTRLRCRLTLSCVMTDKRRCRWRCSSLMMHQPTLQPCSMITKIAQLLFQILYTHSRYRYSQVSRTTAIYLWANRNLN